MSNKTKIIAVAGKGGVGKTSLAGVIVKLLVESFPDKKILAIDADPAVGLSTVLNVDGIKRLKDFQKYSGQHGERRNSPCCDRILLSKSGTIQCSILPDRDYIK